MRYAKYLGAVGLLALTAGTIVTAIGAVEPSLRLIGSGAAIAFGGLAAINVGSLLAQRRQLHTLDRIKRVLGADPARAADLEQVIRAEVEDVARIVDSRILGLFEMRRDD